jgi:hypothetical protein
MLIPIQSWLAFLLKKLGKGQEACDISLWEKNIIGRCLPEIIKKAAQTMILLVNNKKLSRKNSDILLFLGFMLCLFIAFFKESIFPAKYFWDADTIEFLILHPRFDSADNSFMNTANFYRVIGLDRSFLAPLFSIVSYLGVVLFLFKRYNVRRVSMGKYWVILIFSVIAMVYMSVYSKEFVLFVFVIIPFTLFEKKNIWVWFLFVVFYAFAFRSYWFLVLAVFFITRLFLVLNPKRLLAFIPIFFIVFAIVYLRISGQNISAIRESVNLVRGVGEAQTMIVPYIIGESALLQGLNNLVTFLFLVVPIPLFLILKPFYIILGTLITMFFYYFLSFYWKNRNDKEYRNIFSFIFSQILVLSLFEPDYGSFVRHISPLFPFIFVCIVKFKHDLHVSKRVKKQYTTLNIK